MSLRLAQPLLVLLSVWLILLPAPTEGSGLKELLHRSNEENNLRKSGSQLSHIQQHQKTRQDDDDSDQGSGLKELLHRSNEENNLRKRALSMAGLTRATSDVPYNSATLVETAIDSTTQLFKSCFKAQRTFSFSKYYSIAFPVSTPTADTTNEYRYYVPEALVAAQSIVWTTVSTAFTTVVECATAADRIQAVMFKFDGTNCRTTNMQYCPYKHVDFCDDETSEPVYYSTVYNGTTVADCEPDPPSTVDPDDTTPCPPEVCSQSTVMF